MTAKEMFRELGKIKYEFKNNDNIIYTNDNETSFIYFNLKNKTFRKESENGFSLNITLIEFKAIQKQIEELGW